MSRNSVAYGIAARPFNWQSAVIEHPHRSSAYFLRT